MKPTNQDKRQAEPAEIPDDAEIAGGANYELDGLTVIDPDPAKHYYFAADDRDKSRPDGVHRLLQMGYVRSDKKHTSADCVLLEEPIAAYEARERKRHAMDRMKLRSTATPQGVESPVQIREDGKHGIASGMPVKE